MWWNRPEEDLSSGKSDSTHPSRTIVKSIEFFYGVESVVRGNADSLLKWEGLSDQRSWAVCPTVFTYSAINDQILINLGMHIIKEFVKFNYLREGHGPKQGP